MSANVCNEHGIICSLANANGHCRVSACYNRKVDYVPFKEAVPKPNKDLVEVVRCKECKYEHQCQKAVQHTTHELTSATIAYRPIDYCSYGERRG